MKKLPDVLAMVTLDSVGETTKSRFIGQFKIKRKLTHADRFQLERIYAQLLPSREREIEEELRLRAAAIAELSVRVVEAPSWWDGSKNGQLLVDSQPLYDLALLCSEEEKKWAQQLEELAKTEESNAIPVLSDDMK